MDLTQLRHMSLLIVDNDLADNQQLELYLEQRLHIFSAPEGRQALDLLSHESIQLVLLADNITDMNCFDLLRKIHAQEQYKNLPVIIMTTDHSQKTEAASAMAAFRTGIFGLPIP